MINPNFVILGSSINIAGSLNYVVNTLKGKTRPNRVSFFMWTLAPMLAFAAELQKGIGLTSLMTFAAGFCPLLILLASFADKKAVWKLTSFDLTCGALSLLGLTLWAITREGNIAIFFSITADFLAAVPTIRKSYSHPDSESWLGYFTGAISAGIALLTIKQWNFANYGFPLYILIVCLVISALVKLELGLRFQELANSRV